MKKAFFMFLTCLILCSLLICPVMASAEPGQQITLADGSKWPTKAVTILAGYSAGGNVDILCRFLAASLTKELGVPVVVENLPGSGSWLAWNQLLNSTPDGYTFTQTNLSTVLGHYDPRNPREATIDDFELLANISIDYNVLAIRNDETRFKDYPSLIEYAKNNPLVVAASGDGITSGDGTVIKYLQDKFGCKITIVPVDGNADALTMFLAGETDFLTGNTGDMSDAEANGYHAIVVFADQPSEFLPGVPTAAETGMGDYIAFSARGFGYQKGVDPAIVKRMIEAIEISFNDPEFQANMATTGSELRFASGQDYYNLLVGQLDRRLEIWGLTK